MNIIRPLIRPVLALGLMLAVVPPSSAAGRSLGKLQNGTEYVPNEIKVALKAGFASQLSPTGQGRRPVDKLRLRSLHRHVKDIRGGHTAAENWLDGQPLPARIRHREGEVPRMARSVTVVLKDGVDATEVLAEIQALPEVEGAALNVAYAVNEVPNDPDYDRQWSLPLIQAEEAWDISPRSTGIDIAIVDTGVDLNHPDLGSTISYQRGFGGNTSGNAPTDGRAAADHGTHVAGIAAAIRNNSVGVAGVAQAQIMAMGCSRWSEDAGKYLITDASDAINDAVANGAEVINCSFGSGVDADLDPFTLWALDSAEDNGVLVVCSAGNESGRLDPGKSWDGHDHPFIISATDSDDGLASYSNWGEPIDLAAPGTGIWSTSVNGFTSKDGTSMSAPHVAGAAALLMSMNPDLVSDAGAKGLLRRMAQDIGSHLNFGSGRLNLPGAFIRTLRDAEHFVVTNPDTLALGTGSYASPVRSLRVAVAAASPGDTIVLSGRMGSWTEPPMTITKRVTLTAFPDRSGVIGQAPYIP